MVVQPFEFSREHLNAELARIDLIIQREVWRWRQMNSPQPQSGDEFRGLYVSESEVDAILSGVYPGSRHVSDRAVDEPTEQAFRQAIDQATAQIAARAAASAQAGIALRLTRLRALLALDPFDVDLLLVASACELDLRYERLYAYLQDDVTRKRPGVAMVLNLLCATPVEKQRARTRLGPDAPLQRHRLISLFVDPAQPQPPLLAHYIKPDPRIVEWLLQEESAPSTEIDHRLHGIAALSFPQAEIDELLLDPPLRADLALLAQDAGKAPPIMLLLGDADTAKREAAAALCTAWSCPMLTAHLGRIQTSGGEWQETVLLAAREAHLLGAGVYWQDYDLLIPPLGASDPDLEKRRDAFHQALLSWPAPSFLPIHDENRQPDAALLRASRLARIIFPRPGYALRRALWHHFMSKGELSHSADLDQAAGRFRLTHGQIQTAVLDARHRAAQRAPGQQQITAEDIFAAARARTSEQLLHLAKKIEPRHTWNDLVLPQDPVTQLHEMCDQMRHRPIVLGEWGFDNKLSLGKGLNALFAGPSGTGKTMAAEVIARDLGLDLYKIDLSTIVSKYIGETEKNLERIFSAARNSNAILFFDEADALFGKRSEVRDAHDRYANVEISYLLQKMEEYDGLVILTTNLNKNMDEAFVRRMHFTIEFPYPEPDARRRIWEISFPTEAPVAPTVDLDELAERYRLTGGNIRNIVLTAAFLAAKDGGVIDMDHLFWATRREYQKMGRLADEREFESRQARE